MVYLYVKKKGNNKYYYLRKSFRKGKKTFTKEICYIGKNLSKISKEEKTETIKKNIAKIISLEKIKKLKIKENKFFDKNQITEINAILMNYKKNIGNKGIPHKKELFENFNLKFITENISIDSIETKYLNQKEISDLIKNKITPKKQKIDQIYKAINTKKILEFLKKEKPEINLQTIEKISQIILNNLSRITGYRKHNIKIPGKRFKVSDYKNIKSELKKLISWYNKNKTKIPSLALVILFHSKFEKIHPLVDRNGDIGRILINYQLSQFNYPPIIIPRKNKEEYYKVMNKAYPCLKKDLLSTDMKYYSDLINFMHKQFVKTYWENFV